MSYIDQNLIPGETVMYRTRLHGIVLFLPFIIAFVLAFGGFSLLVGDATAKHHQSGMWQLALVLIVVGLAIFGIAALNRSSIEMAVTNRRVMIKAGVLSRRTIEMSLNKIESIGVDQTLFGRMCNYGTITVRGTGGTPEPFAKISHPLEFRKRVHEQMDAQQPAAISH